MSVVTIWKDRAVFLRQIAPGPEIHCAKRQNPSDQRTRPSTAQRKDRPQSRTCASFTQSLRNLYASTLVAPHEAQGSRASDDSDDALRATPPTTHSVRSEPLVARTHTGDPDRRTKKRKKRRGRASTRDRLEDIQVEMLDKVARQFKFDVTEIGSLSVQHPGPQPEDAEDPRHRSTEARRRKAGVHRGNTAHGIRPDALRRRLRRQERDRRADGGDNPPTPTRRGAPGDRRRGDRGPERADLPDSARWRTRGNRRRHRGRGLGEARGRQAPAPRDTRTIRTPAQRGRTRVDDSTPNMRGSTAIQVGPAPQTRYGDPKRAARPFRDPKTCL